MGDMSAAVWTGETEEGCWAGSSGFLCALFDREPENRTNPRIATVSPIPVPASILPLLIEYRTLPVQTWRLVFVSFVPRVDPKVQHASVV